MLKQEEVHLKKPIRVKDVMTESELEEFEELNNAVLTSATKMEREFYNKEIKKLIERVKTRYFEEKKEVMSS